MIYIALGCLAVTVASLWLIWEDRRARRHNPHRTFDTGLPAYDAALGNIPADRAGQAVRADLMSRAAQEAADVWVGEAS